MGIINQQNKRITTDTAFLLFVFVLDSEQTQISLDNAIISRARIHPASEPSQCLKCRVNTGIV